MWHFPITHFILILFYSIGFIAKIHCLEWQNNLQNKRSLWIQLSNLNLKISQRIHWIFHWNRPKQFTSFALLCILYIHIQTCPMSMEETSISSALNVCEIAATAVFHNKIGSNSWILKGNFVLNTSNQVCVIAKYHQIYYQLGGIPAWVRSIVEETWCRCTGVKE